MRHKTAFVLACVGLLGLALAGEPGADKDKVLAWIDKGKAAVQADRPQEAIAHLQKAIQLLHASVEKGLVTYLPAVPKGWAADDPTSQSGAFGSGEQAFQWTFVQRSYRQEEGGDAQCDIQITNSPEIVEGQRQMLEMMKNPEMRKMMQAGGDVTLEPVDADGWSGILSIPKDGETTLTAVRGPVLVMITGDDAKTVKAFWTAMDRKGLAAATATKKD